MFQDKSFAVFFPNTYFFYSKIKEKVGGDELEKETFLYVFA